MGLPAVSYSHPKEDMLRIFIALKNRSPWAGSNRRPLGPVANTVAILPKELPAIKSNEMRIAIVFGNVMLIDPS
jgi:hypothetical protein